MPRAEPTSSAPGEDTKVCPYCAEVIKAAAIKCRYCQSDLVEVPAAAARTRATERPGQSEGPTQPPPPSAGEPPKATKRPKLIKPAKPAKPAKQPKAAPQPGADRPARRPWFLPAAGVAVLLVLVFLTLAFLDWRSAREITAAEDAARTVRASVTDKVEALLSYEHSTFDEDLEAAQEGMTPSFQDEYAPTVDEIRDRAVAQERSQEADVVAVAVVSKSAEEVETLVFVNTLSSREGSERQRLMQNRVSVRMIKQDGEWLIDELSVPQA